MFAAAWRLQTDAKKVCWGSSGPDLKMVSGRVPPNKQWSERRFLRQGSWHLSFGSNYPSLPLAACASDKIKIYDRRSDTAGSYSRHFCAGRNSEPVRPIACSLLPTTCRHPSSARPVTSATSTTAAILASRAPITGSCEDGLTAALHSVSWHGVALSIGK